MVHVCNKQSTECVAHGKINCGKCEYWGLPQESASRSDDWEKELDGLLDDYAYPESEQEQAKTYFKLKSFIKTLLSTQRKLDRELYQQINQVYKDSQDIRIEYKDGQSVDLLVGLKKLKDMAELLDK